MECQLNFFSPLFLCIISYGDESNYVCIDIRAALIWSAYRSMWWSQNFTRSLQQYFTLIHRVAGDPFYKLLNNNRLVYHVYWGNFGGIIDDNKNSISDMPAVQKTSFMSNIKSSISEYIEETKEKFIIIVLI